MIDLLEAERFAPLGEEPLCVIDLAEPDARSRAAELASMTQAIIVGVDRGALLPMMDAGAFDVLITTADKPPAPWVQVAPGQLQDRLGRIAALTRQAPVAAAVCAQVLRMNGSLAFRDALKLESLAYSTLLSGEAFRRWRDAHPPTPIVKDDGDPILCEREGDRLTLRLNHPSSRNAMRAGMRDALFGALAAALDDPSAPTVRLEGDGACFSTGGDLDEFGSARDLATAHAVRTMRSCADLLHRLGDRAEAVLHGACIGSGIEVPAAAARRIGRPGVFFQLPELSMGLMPGAGGTVSVSRAIGRHRTAYLALSGRKIDARTALEWGLLHGIEGDE